MRGMNRNSKLAAAALIALGLAACRGAPATVAPTLSVPVVEDQTSGTAKLLQAVSVVDSSVVWVSGQGATWAVTMNAGRAWRAGVVPGDSALEFRDVHAESARAAWLLASGPGARSRVYHTTTGGAVWLLQWTNDEPDGFYDCFDFWDARRAVLFGDAVGGSLRVLTTDDGGRTWRRVPSDRLPAAVGTEGGFAASGTCAVVRPGGRAWIATGNGPRARVLATSDYGVSWSAAETPIPAAEGAGLTSVSMTSDSAGTVFGGRLTVTDARGDQVARTADGGRSWTLAPRLAMLGPAFGGVHVPGTGGRALLVVGPGGLDFSRDGAQSWQTADSRAWWGIGSAGPLATWIAGPSGRIARVRLR